MVVYFYISLAFWEKCYLNISFKKIYTRETPQNDASLNRDECNFLSSNLNWSFHAFTVFKCLYFIWYRALKCIYFWKYYLSSAWDEGMVYHGLFPMYPMQSWHIISTSKVFKVGSGYWFSWLSCPHEGNRMVNARVRSGQCLRWGIRFWPAGYEGEKWGRIEWTIQSEGLLEQRKEGKNKQKQTNKQNIGCTQATPNRPIWLDCITCIRRF